MALTHTGLHFEDEKVKSVVEKDDDGMLVNDNLSDSSNSTK